jgi:hypothetical protein
MSAPRYGMSIRDLTEEEINERCLLLKNVRIVNIEDSGSVKCVIVEDHPEVKKIRVHYEYKKIESWFKDHIGSIVDIDVFPYKWEAAGRSGTIFYFRRVSVKEQDGQE